MKRGHTLKKFAKELFRQQQTKRNFIVPMESMRMGNDATHFWQGERWKLYSSRAGQAYDQATIIKLADNPEGGRQ